MNFNKHFDLEGRHAFLGASKYSWVNYDESKLVDVYRKSLAIKHGTELHDFAAHCIRLGQPLPKRRKTLNMYVNDAIARKMTPEQALYYSDNCFGTADAIAFNDDFLRIHDLKTGTTPAHFEQLLVYAALFCLEYCVKPGEIKTELRIYQNDEVIVRNAQADEIAPIMDKIISFDKILNRVKIQEG